MGEILAVKLVSFFVLFTLFQVNYVHYILFNNTYRYEYAYNTKALGTYVLLYSVILIHIYFHVREGWEKRAEKGGKNVYDCHTACRLSLFTRWLGIF